MVANYDMKEVPKSFNEFAHNSVLQLFTHLKEISFSAKTLRFSLCSSKYFQSLIVFYGQSFGDVDKAVKIAISSRFIADNLTFTVGTL